MTQSYEDKRDKYMEKYRAGETSFLNVEERAWGVSGILNRFSPDERMGS